jgi:LVIVD repeat-containing protein
MRKSLASAWVLVASVLFVVPGGATSASAEPGPGYFATDNVEWLLNIPLHTDGAGAEILGNYMYITDSRELTIYDISDPELPIPTGYLLRPQEPYYAEEDVDTNGKILLISALGDMSVIDVTDKTAPVEIGTVGVDQHTITCVLDCTWAYGSEGTIVDLRDPANPKVAGNWKTSLGPGVGNAHDVTEVSPGIVVTSQNPLRVMDARENPANPKPFLTPSDQPLTARVPGASPYVHGNLWPQGGTDKFLLVGSEGTLNCKDNESGAFFTFEKQVDPETGAVTGFDYRDQYHLPTGLPTDGNSPYDTFCSHWFSTHPKFYKDGGLVAMSWYEHGVRFLNVSPTNGDITEVGYFMGFGTSTSASYWVTDEIVYSVDYQRGLDILRFTNEPATGEISVPGAPGYAVGVGAISYTTDGPRSKGLPFACPIPRSISVA